MSEMKAAGCMVFPCSAIPLGLSLAAWDAAFLPCLITSGAGRCRRRRALPGRHTVKFSAETGLVFQSPEPPPMARNASMH